MLVVLALAAPLYWSSNGKPLPSIFSGDEPHYLLTINSLLLDGDLDLANNYAGVHKGSRQAGANFAGAPLDHQSVWFEHGVRQNWENVYENESDKFDRDAEGHPLPRLRPGLTEPMPGHPEYSTHPPGMALLIAPVLYPFRHTEFVEPMAIVCSTFAVIIAFFLFRSLLLKYAVSSLSADLVAIVAFLGTPAWPYGRTLFSEPYLLMCAVGAYSLALRWKMPLVAGVFIGIGIVIKAPLGLISLPLLAMYLNQRDYASLVRLALPVGVGIAVIGCLNSIMFGSPLNASQPWQQGSLVRGVGGMLFSLKYGYLMIAPATVAAAVAWPSFLRRFPKDGIVIASGILLYTLVMASWKFWNGATAYAARQEVPVVPLFCVALIALPGMQLWQKRGIRIAVFAICAISIVINGFAAVHYWESWDTNLPLRLASFLKDRL